MFLQTNIKILLKIVCRINYGYLRCLSKKVQLDMKMILKGFMTNREAVYGVY